MTSRPASQEWVLALDDDPWALEITRTFLESSGIAVHTAATPDDALGAIGRLGTPAVVLLDAMMPDADGFELCRRFRATPGLRSTRIVFVTALDDEKSRVAALEAGADDLITKPVNEAMLITRIRSLMELARYQEQDHRRLEYETVLETIGEGVVTVDEEGYVIAANRAAVTLLGLPHDPLGRIHLPSIIEANWTVERGSISSSSSARLLWRHGGHGVSSALDWTSRHLPAMPGAAARWTAVVRDATDLWEQDHALGRLLRTVGHKLRIPLTGITTSIELAGENPSLDAEARDLLGIAAESAGRLADTLLRILSFTDAAVARGSSNGTARLDPAQARDQLEIPDHVHLDSTLPRPVQVDLDLARRGLAELIANAGMADAKNITAVVREEPDRAVTFAVVDDGCGFPTAAADRLFEPFYQIDRSGEAPGTGLGLSILAAEVEAGGGSVGASAPPGGLTTVWLRLPSGGSEVALSARDTPTRE